MDEDAELGYKDICCTCLSTDRKLEQLCKISNGVNNLYFLLTYDSEAYKEGFFKDSASFYICWECRALLHKFSAFRLQACTAQKQLSTSKNKTLKTLSLLTRHHKTSYDETITSKTDLVSDNFIDCNGMDIKTEEEGLDDIPLSELHAVLMDEEVENDSNHLDEEFPLAEYDSVATEKTSKVTTKQKKETSTKNNVKNKTKKNNLYQIMRIKTKEMWEIREKKKLDAMFADAPFKCVSCVEVLKTETELTDHNLALHTKIPNTILCDICSSYTPKAMLLKHRRSHFFKYKCQFCEHTAYYVEEILEHLNEKHDCKKAVTSRRKKGGTADSKQQDVVSSVRSPRGYQCPECHKNFESKNHRWRHIQRCHKEGYRCHACGKRFAFSFSLTRHELTHSAPPPRSECPVCHKMVRTDLARAHARIHTARKQYSCEACNKQFVSLASYQHHLKYTMRHTTADILKYKCSVCDKGYRSRGELRDHENYQHAGRTAHQCPVCGKALATRRCITRHVRRAHHGVKENARDKVCQQCGKTFRDKKGLREHEFIHTGERPLSCEVCGCTFRQSASLYTHRKRVHKIHAPRKEVKLLKENEAS